MPVGQDRFSGDAVRGGSNLEDAVVQGQLDEVDDELAVVEDEGATRLGGSDHCCDAPSKSDLTITGHLRRTYSTTSSRSRGPESRRWRLDLCWDEFGHGAIPSAFHKTVVSVPRSA